MSTVTLTGTGWSAVLTRSTNIVTAVITVPPGGPTGYAIIPGEFQPIAGEVIGLSSGYPGSLYVEGIAANAAVGGTMLVVSSDVLTSPISLTMQWLVAPILDPVAGSDVEAILVPVVQAAFPATRVLTSTPNDLETILPVIKLLHTGGVGDWQRMDSVGIEFDVFHTTKGQAAALARDLYHWCMERMPSAFGPVGVRRVDDNTLPIETAYANSDIYRYSFGVTIHTHDRRI